MLPASFSRPKSSKSPPKPRGTPFSSESTKRLDDDSSLLQDHQSNFQNEFFGQFKGFRLSPINANEENKQPVRTIPAVPSVPTIPNVAIKKVTRSSTTPIAMVKPVQQSAPLPTEHNVSVVCSQAPSLPPLNPGSTARPLISSPILKASTCTAKELISPLKAAPKVPVRPAPEIPENPRPLSGPINPTVAIILEDIQKDFQKPKETKETSSKLNRITSFLKTAKEDKSKDDKVGKLAKSLDKNALRSIEISNPIPQSEITIAANALPAEVEKTRSVVMRAQSMRGANVTPRPNIQTFGSMRQANGAKRPTSIPVGNRPKSPPPPRPPLPDLEKHQVNKIPGEPGYQEPGKPAAVATIVSKPSEYQYDDCLNEAPLAKISEEGSPNSNSRYDFKSFIVLFIHSLFYTGRQHILFS